MYCDSNKLAYLTYLNPILKEVQMVKRSFESNNADPSKLISDLTLLVNSVAKRFINPYCREDNLTCNMDSYTSPNIKWPYEFTQILQQANKSSEESKMQFKYKNIYYYIYYFQ